MLDDLHRDPDVVCTCTRIHPNQLRMFDTEIYFVEPAYGRYGQHLIPGHPRESLAGKIGFDRDLTRDVFRWRSGGGPLIACLDTSILIWLVDEIERMEEGIGLITAPLLGGDWNDEVESVRAILYLWQFRDIRLFVSDHYLSDGKLTETRSRVRRRVHDELALDFAMRGGFDEYEDETDEFDFESREERNEFGRFSFGCPVHSRQPSRLIGLLAKWPHSKDRPLLADALRQECDVFLTFDKGVLACAEAFAPFGLTLLSPTELLERLDRDGQLDVVPDWPVDLDAVARFYGIAVEIDEAA
jgi:hypothetical protein